MSRLDAFPDSTSPDIEHLRQGTRRQWESDWTELADSASVTFTHDLGEIPWTVDVIRAIDSGGASPLDANASVSIAKTDTTITVTSALGSSAYFKARAL